MTPIDVSSSQLETINLILAEHVPDRRRAIAFGSRAKWTAKAQSDLDLAIDAGRKLKFAELAALEDAFESSPLPWKVDVIDLNGVSEGFRVVILRDGVALPASRPQSGWHDQKLGDLIELKRGYDLPQTQRRDGPYPIISSSGLSGHHDRFMAEAPGVVTGRYGTIGEVFYVTEDFWPLNTALYVRDFKGAHPRYVYYLLKTLNWSLFNDKSGVPGVNRNHVHEAVVQVPPLAEQKRIAGCLSAFDDKIELNRRMNESLEAMAQVIFRDWFIDFGPVRRKLSGETDLVAIMGGLTLDSTRAAELAALFPTSLTDEGLPEGWTDSPIGDQVEIAGGSTPSTADDSLWNPAEHRWATPKDLSNMSDLALFETGRRISSAGLAKITSGLLPTGTVLLSSRAPIGYLAIAQEPVAINQGFIALRPTTDHGSAYLYLWCKANMEAILANANGSTFQEISKKNFRPITSATPDDPAVLRAFGDIAQPLIDRIVSAAKENSSLVETRDYLLPRLMSGQVRVSEAGKITKETAA